MNNGNLFLKLENASNAFRNRFTVELVSYYDSQGLLQYTTNEMIASKDKIFTKSQESERNYFLEQESFHTNSYKINTARAKRKDGGYKRNSKASSKEITHTAPPAKSAALGGVAIISFGKYLYDTYGDFNVYSDLNNINEQISNQKYYDPWSDKMITKSSIFYKAIQDIETAKTSGLIDASGLNEKEYGQLINIVMFGGNGNEGERITEMGRTILYNVTGDQRDHSNMPEYIGKHELPTEKEKSKYIKDNNDKKPKN
jgi:hypothetical protein